MTRYVLEIDLEPGAVLELSTGYPHSAEIVDISEWLSTGLRTERQEATRTDSADSDGSVGSGRARLRLRKASPEASLTENELIRAHGGLDP